MTHLTTKLDIPLFSALYALVKELYLDQASIPKLHRYTLWQKTLVLALEILEQLMQAVNLTSNARIVVLETMDFKLDMLRVLLRLAQELKIIDLKKYSYLQEKITDIGRMLGGWLRANKK
jgi:hypothetical protein